MIFKNDLKVRIIENASAGIAQRAVIRASRGDARYAAWVEKRSIGDTQTTLLLAYAFVRNRACFAQHGTLASQDESTRRSMARNIVEVLYGKAPAKDVLVAEFEAIFAWLSTPMPLTTRVINEKHRQMHLDAVKARSEQHRVMHTQAVAS